MNTKQLIAAVAMITATGTALAFSSEFTAADAGFVSTKTRAQVLDELKQAGKQGSLTHYDGEDVNAAAIKSIRSNVAAHGSAGARELTGVDLPQLINGHRNLDYAVGR